MTSSPLYRSRTFDPLWPNALVEMKDFVDLSRLACGGTYREMKVRVHLSRAVPPELLASPVFQDFRNRLETLPRCQAHFEPVDLPVHRVDLEIWR